MTFARDDLFDGAVMSVVYHCIDRRAQLLAELQRTLRPGAWLVVVTTHPTADWARFDGAYFAVEPVSLAITKDWHYRYWRMPLEVFVSELLGAGLVLDRLIEPQPDEALAKTAPDDYARLQMAPSFLALRLHTQGKA